MRDGVADSGGRGKGEVNDTERNAESLGSLRTNELTHSCDLERGLFDDVSYLADVCVGVLAERSAYNAGSGNAYVYLAVVLANTVECARHEGVILYCVAEYNDLCSAEVAVVLGSFRGVKYHLTHHSYCVHVDTSPCGADVDGGANVACFSESLRNGLDKLQVACGESLVDKRGVTAEIVYAGAVGSALERLRELHGAALARSGDHRDRRNGDTLVDYRDTVLLFDVLAGLYKVLSLAHYLVVYLVASLVDVAVDTVEKGDTHCDGTDIQVLLLYHLYRF